MTVKQTCRSPIVFSSPFEDSLQRTNASACTALPNSKAQGVFLLMDTTPKNKTEESWEYWKVG